MTPFYSDEWLTLYGGDCRAVLSELPADSVDCVVTSPPYWGLRDYGTATWAGGDEACPHRVAATGSTMNKGNNNREGKPFPAVCGRCGASRSDSQLGLERTPEEYVANLVAVFAEVRRVLKPSGTCWLNLGDSYNSIGHKKSGSGYGTTGLAGGKAQEHHPLKRENSAPGLKHKDLVGIPWRVAFALQADGWYLRSEITWCKPNAMPESVTDRPTSATEKLFLLSKRPVYYFDSEAVRERVASVIETPNRLHKGVVLSENLRPEESAAVGSVSPSSVTDSLVGFWQSVGEAATILDGTQLQNDVGLSAFDAEEWSELTENGDGQQVAGSPVVHRAASETSGFLDADGSTEQLLQDGDGLRITLSDDDLLGIVGRAPKSADAPLVNSDGNAAIGVNDTSSVGQEFASIHSEKYTADAPTSSRNIRNWWVIPSRPYKGAHFAVFPPELPERCIKAGSPENGLVLDPFAGSGTVGMVANRLSRRAILIDLNPEYLKQQMRRNAQTPLGLLA